MGDKAEDDVFVLESLDSIRDGIAAKKHDFSDFARSNPAVLRE